MARVSSPRLSSGLFGLLVLVGKEEVRFEALRAEYVRYWIARLGSGAMPQPWLLESVFMEGKDERRKVYRSARP